MWVLCVVCEIQISVKTVILLFSKRTSELNFSFSMNSCRCTKYDESGSFHIYIVLRLKINDSVCYFYYNSDKCHPCSWLIVWICGSVNIAYMTLKMKKKTCKYQNVQHLFVKTSLFLISSGSSLLQLERKKSWLTALSPGFSQIYTNSLFCLQNTLSLLPRFYMIFSM